MIFGLCKACNPFCDTLTVTVKNAVGSVHSSYKDAAWPF